MSAKLGIGISALIVGLALGLWIGLRLGELKGSADSSEKEGRALGIEGQLAYQEGSSSPTPTPEPSPTWEPSTSPTPSPYPTSEGMHSPTPTPESGVGGVPYQESNTVDRLAQVDAATMNCIRARLTSFELERMRYLVPKTREEEEELKRLEEKVKICFESYSEVVKIEEASGKISELSDGIEECLRREVGDLAFREIESGIRKPTEDEMRRGEKCFEGRHESEIRYQTGKHELAEDIEDCLRLAIGDERFDKIERGIAQPTLSEREKVERCFGASPQPFRGRPRFEIAKEIDACLRESVGVARYESIKSGGSEPTDEEKVKGEKCFNRLNKTQVNFLPPPPDRVPYLSTRPELIGVVSVSEKIEEVKPRLFDRKLVLSGKGPPNLVVDIFIFSTPIVVTTKADANGDWVYELNQPLEGERHIAYATVRTEGGQMVRSSVFDFQVVAAADLGQPLLEESRATAVPSKFLTYAVALIGLGVVVVIGGMGYVYVTKRSLREGKSEGKDRAGPVN